MLVFSSQIYSHTSVFWETKIAIRGVQSALDSFYLDVGRYPSHEEGLKILYQKQEKLPNWKGPYIEDKFFIKDAWGQKLVYIAPSKVKNFLKQLRKTDEDINYLVYSIGANGINEKSQGDDITKNSNPTGLALRKTIFYIFLMILAILLLTVMGVASRHCSNHCA